MQQKLYFQVDLQWILSVVPLPLSQGVLLYLLWQLACDISNRPFQKVAWMTVVANAIIPTDPAIAVHGQPILFQVYNILNHQSTCPHQSTLPTQAGVELSNIHFLIDVINSIIMTSK
jgi:enhancer of mRNA-decapping protein 4